MASILSEDSVDNFSDHSQFSSTWDENMCDKSDSIFTRLIQNDKNTNVVNNIFNRQLYGRFTKHPKAKTERIFHNIHTKCRYALNSLIKDPDTFNHIFMGFTMCGQYFVSYTEKMYQYMGPQNFSPTYEYELFLWRFVPGQKLTLLSKHKIFKHHNNLNLKGSEVLDKVMFLQFPRDLYKIVCYGLAATNPDIVYVSILTLPAPKNCRHCNLQFYLDDSVNQGWCVKHGFIVHYMFAMSQPSPVFDPYISLAYPNHLIINTGHHIHILNVSTMEPPQASSVSLSPSAAEEKLLSNTPTHAFNDALSEVSETASEHFGSTSVVDAILEDFSEYDLESNECNKPFHELNISCEPLNVTGKSYHNTLVQNIVDPRLKRLQTGGGGGKEYLFSVPQSSGATQKTSEKTKIDKKIAEKAYEFIEENEKYEKISSFRKKRLAEKKYEFSEDNSENIVPFNSLRRERRYLYRSQTRCIRSPDYNSLFLSPRSPMQSPNSRSGQFSPSGGARHLYSPSVRSSPHHSKSPISPKESARKFYVYSPSLDSDCSDTDSRLVLRTSNATAESRFASNGLLIIDPKLETPKWIKKVVRRYSNGDFENGSLVSGQSRDDYNIPIEIPLLVQNLTDQHLDVVPDFKVDQVTEMQLIVTQRSFDCEHFVQRRAQKLCSEAQLEFLHCDDYDIRIIHICPINGHIICHAIIKIGALRKIDPYGKPENFTANFLFTWSIESDAFDVLEQNKESTKLSPCSEPQDIPEYELLPTKDVLVMDFNYAASKTSLRDFNNYYEICLGSANVAHIRLHNYVTQGYSSDSD
ncbi:uncharacterized protein isoform X1 [Leptinotarsa decemlineata]|uniref:uncharacterized protein isoform X1 n=1 Tax=Leptinotarsa decemlineata TaxID=7539 RepID=UPI003D30AADF